MTNIHSLSRGCQRYTQLNGVFDYSIRDTSQTVNEISNIEMHVYQNPNRTFLIVSATSVITDMYTYYLHTLFSSCFSVLVGLADYVYI